MGLQLLQTLWLSNRPDIGHGQKSLFIGWRGNNEGAIFRCPDGRWQATIVLPAGRNYDFGQTRSDAARKLRRRFKSGSICRQFGSMGRQFDLWRPCMCCSWRWVAPGRGTRSGLGRCGDRRHGQPLAWSCQAGIGLSFCVKVREVITMLEAEGWRLDRAGGEPSTV